MASTHPSDALMSRFEHDRMTCEVIPTSAGRNLVVPALGRSSAAAVLLPAGAACLAMLFADGEAAIGSALFVSMFSWMLPVMSYVRQRRIEVSLTTSRLEITWKVGDLVTGRRSFELAAIRSVYTTPASHQTPPMLRIAADGDEVWFGAGGVPATSLEWLAEEINRAAAAARERDAAGPPLELEQLLSESTRAARQRYLSHAASKRQRA